MNDSLISKLSCTGITKKEVEFNFFMPINKLSGNSTIRKEFIKNNNVRVVNTPNGKMEIRNRLLTEHDQKIINAIFYLGEIRVMKDGNIASFFNEKEILLSLKMGNNRTSLRNNIKRIADAQYYIPVGSITRRVSIVKEHIISKREPDGVKSHAIVFDPEYIRIYKHDFSIDYKPLFKKIVNIEFPTIPSIIKFIFTRGPRNKNKIYMLNDLLERIGFPIESDGSMREIKANLKNYKETLEREYNIIYSIENKTIQYVGMEDFKILKPLVLKEERIERYINKKIKYENRTITILSINKDGDNGWIIKHEDGEIKINAYLDDLMFLLENTSL